MGKSAGGWVLFAIGIIVLLIGIGILGNEAWHTGTISLPTAVIFAGCIVGGIIILVVQQRHVP